nr:hypothetical protein [Tanacetum cinerariifolium]
MEIEPDIESMTLNEYLEYEAKKERQSWRNDSAFDEIVDDLFRIGAENIRQMGQEKFRMGDVDLEKKEAHVEDDDDYGNICDIYDITAEDVELIRQFLMPNFPDEMNEVIQPLIPQPIHTTPLNDDYVAPATKSILDELLEEFSNDILNVTMVDKEADFSPTKDIEELKKTSR